MSVSFDSAVTQQSATSHQCSRDADGDGEGGRNGYPSDSMKANLTKKFYVAEPEDHDQTRTEEFDSGEAPYPTSDEDDSDEEEADSSDSEGAGATETRIPGLQFCRWQYIGSSSNSRTVLSESQKRQFISCRVRNRF